MEITRSFDLLDQIGEKYADKHDMLAGIENGEWRRYSSQDYLQNAYRVAYGLLALGLKKGDKIATISNNRPEWNFTDMGMAMAGLVQVPIYPTISAEEYDYILGHAEPKLIFLSDKGLFDKISPIAKKNKSIQRKRSNLYIMICDL